MQVKKKILYGDIEVQDAKGKSIIKDAVFLEGDTEYKRKKILKVICFKEVGETHTSTKYTEAKASDEKRNNITGAYE